MKTELFENADVTASICNPSEHALGSLGITCGHFVYLFSDFECQRFRVVGAKFENAPREDADIFYMDKTDAFSIISGYVWTGP